MPTSNLPDKIRKNLDDFVGGLNGIYGAGLVSVILYGSAASGEYALANSNVNIAVVLDDAGLANVARASGLVNKSRYRMIKPLFFTEKYIASSVDVFPVEFLDMKENHIVLYGRDVAQDLKIDAKNLRFQCEQELKSKLINIKTAYLDRRPLRDRKKMLFKFFTSSLHILRNVLRLKSGTVPPYSKEEIAGRVALEFGADAGIFRKVLEARSGKADPGRAETERLFFGLTAELEKISEAVDRA